MSSYPNLKRWLAALATVGVLAVVLLLTGVPGRQPQGEIRAGNPKAEGWFMFGGTPQRNMINPAARNLPVTFSAEEGETKGIIWSADLGSKAYGGPIIADGKVFIGTNNQKPRDKKYLDAKGRPIDLGIVMAFDQAKGKFLWQQVYFKLDGGRVRDWPEEGICSTPTVEGDKLYYVSNRCEVVKAGTDGTIDWKLDMIKDLGVFPHNISACSPLLVGDHLYIITANGVDEGHINVPAPKAPSFIKVDKNTKKVLWQNNWPTVKLTEKPNKGDEEEFFKRLVNRGELIQHGQWSNPAYGVVDGQAQTIWPGGEGWIYSFNPEGELLWKFDCNPKDSKYELQGKGTRNDFIATPVVYKDKVYIAVGQDPEHEKGVGHLYCIDMKKGKGGADVSPELVVDNTVWPPKTKANPNSAQVWHYGGFITDPAERKKIGRNYYFGRTMSTCAIKDDILYVAELVGNLHCLDANTGKVNWIHDCGAATWSSPYWADNKVYMGTDNEQLLVFAHGKEKKLLATNEMGGRVRATPVAVGETLYVLTENKLYALKKD